MIKMTNDEKFGIAVKSNAYEGSDAKHIDIPEGTVFIDEFAFHNCKNLESVTIPDSVKYIQAPCFVGCENLKSVTLPANLTSMSEIFVGCSSLESIDVSKCTHLQEDLTNPLIYLQHYYDAFDGAEGNPHNAFPDIITKDNIVDMNAAVRDLYLKDYSEEEVEKTFLSSAHLYKKYGCDLGIQGMPEGLMTAKEKAKLNDNKDNIERD